jgi:hypothetical protein
VDRCEAYKVRWQGGDYGFVRERCSATRGLQSYEDTAEVVHFYCPAEGHLADLLRRYADAGDAHLRHSADGGNQDCGRCETEWQAAQVELYG